MEDWHFILKFIRFSISDWKLYLRSYMYNCTYIFEIQIAIDVMKNLFKDEGSNN